MKKSLWPEREKYRLKLWQTPSFLFFLVGILIAAGILALHLVRESPFFSYWVGAMAFLLAIFGIFLNFAILKVFEGLSEVNIIKTRFLSIISNQIRAPMTAIKWVLTFLKRGRPQDLEQRYFDEIDIAEKRISKLVNNITTALALEEGRVFFQKKEVSLEETLERIIKRSEPFAKERKVEIKKMFEKDLPLVKQDPSRLEIVFENLLDNAIRHSKKTGGEAKVILKKEKNNAIVEFQDNGIGIPKSEIPFVFQMFFRASNVEETVEGTGLGLYISKRLIEKLGGKITLESKKDQGTTFRIYFPFE